MFRKARTSSLVRPEAGAIGDRRTYQKYLEESIDVRPRATTCRRNLSGFTGLRFRTSIAIIVSSNIGLSVIERNLGSSVLSHPSSSDRSLDLDPANVCT